MQMNLANKLTMMRVVLIPVFLIVLLSPLVAEPFSRYIAVAIFVVASITDFLDGYIARSRNMVSNFGELNDLPAWVVIIILSREFAITGFRTLAMEANIVMAASWWGKIKTTTQMIMIIVVLLNINSMQMIEWVLITLATFFTIVSGVDYIVKNKNVLKG